jgi:beta-glucosidase
MKEHGKVSRLLLATLVFAGISSLFSGAQEPKITGNARVDHLLGQMTLDEKIAMVHGAAEDAATYQGEAGYLPGVKRLGIPAMRLADGPPGILTRVPSMAPTSRPRVGWTATIKAGFPEISRARMTRCKFPPDNRRTGVSTFGAMMS